jgi:hypothetical protein
MLSLGGIYGRRISGLKPASRKVLIIMTTSRLSHTAGAALIFVGLSTLQLRRLS